MNWKAFWITWLVIAAILAAYLFISFLIDKHLGGKALQVLAAIAVWLWIYSKVVDTMDMNWLNWLWWRRKGCYHFNTCLRCLKPTIIKKALCDKCQRHLDRVC